MKKYLALFVAPLASFETALKASPEEQKGWMEEWNVWMKKVSASAVDMGGPLGKTKSVSATEISDIRNMVGGYMIVQAASHDEAAKLFQDSPHFKLPSAAVEVMEFVSMPETP